MTPNKKILNKLTELTASNCHGECYRLIAEWARDNASNGEAHDTFYTLAKVFAAFNEAHYDLGHLPCYELRYEISKTLYSEIERVYGKAVVNKFYSAC